MLEVNAQNILQWEGLAAGLVSAGVKSFSVLKAAMADAGMDDATIAAMEPKWDLLVNDVRRAAGGGPAPVPSGGSSDGPVG